MPSFYCCANGCTQSRGNKPGPEELDIKFHLFPSTNQELVEKWKQALKKEESFTPQRTTTVCSRHFAESDYKVVSWSQKKLLKRDAVPSRLLYSPTCIDLEKDDTDNAVLPEPELTEDQLNVNNLSFHQKADWVDQIKRDLTRVQLENTPRKRAAEFELFETDSMDQTAKRSRRGIAQSDSRTLFEDYPSPKRLRRTTTNNSEIEEQDRQMETELQNEDYNEEDEEEMVIVVVQNDDDARNCGQDDAEDDYDYSLNGNYEGDVLTSFLRNSGVMPAKSMGKLIGNICESKSLNKNLSPNDEFCRLCLTKRCDMLPLFETNLKFINSSLDVIIESCTGVQVLKEDASDRICQTCLSRLESFWVFREQCEKSDKLMKQMKERGEYDGSVAPSIPEVSNGQKDCKSGDSKVPSDGKGLPFFCSKCGKGFPTEVSLSSHVTNEHLHLQQLACKTFVVFCSICGRKVLRKVIHDHYLGHRVMGHGLAGGNIITAGDVNEIEIDEEGEDDDEDEDEGEEDDEEEMEESWIDEERQPSCLDDDVRGRESIVNAEQHIQQPSCLDDNATEALTTAENVGTTSDKHQLVYNISSGEFLEAQGRSAKNVVDSSKNIKKSQQRVFKTVFVSGSTESADINNHPDRTIDCRPSNIDLRPVALESLQDGNRLFIVNSEVDGEKSIYGNQEVVFQMANDESFENQTDNSVFLRDGIEVVYENTLESVYIKEEVIDFNLESEQD